MGCNRCCGIGSQNKRVGPGRNESKCDIRSVLKEGGIYIEGTRWGASPNKKPVAWACTRRRSPSGPTVTAVYDINLTAATNMR